MMMPIQTLLQAPRPRFAEQTPPVIFPPIFGLLGLGLAWRRAGPALGAPQAIADLISGAVTLLFLFAALAYALKLSRRAGVVAEDLRVLPGRAGLASMVLSFYLLAAVVFPLMPGFARVILFAGFGAHAVLVGLMLWLLATGPAAQRRVTPVFHLHFVGFIVAPAAAIPMGFTAMSHLILIASGVIAALIWLASLAQLLRETPPAPLRPLLAIHLLPASLLGHTALMLGHVGAALAFAALSAAILAALVTGARYLTAAGFSPLWGAFTFPLAAFAGLMLSLAEAGQGEAFRLPAALALVAATLIIPVIDFRVMQAWAKGGLGPKTNAARA